MSSIATARPTELAQPRDLTEAFAQFLGIEVAQGDATPDTIATYKREVSYWLQYLAQLQVRPVEAQRRHVEAYREHLKAAGHTVATRSMRLSVIRRFYDAGIRHGLMQHNPASQVKGGKDLTPAVEKIVALSEKALRELLRVTPASSISSTRDRAMIALMAIHGLRRVEIERLDHEHLDLEGDKPTVLVSGKGNKPRTVPLRPDTARVVRAYVEAKMLAGCDLAGALFVAHGNRSSARLNRRSINKLVDARLEAARLKHERVSCHALRHTYGTLAVAGGAKIEHVSKNMGHSDTKTTGIYVEAVERHKNNPALFINVPLD